MQTYCLNLMGLEYMQSHLDKPSPVQKDIECLLDRLGITYTKQERVLTIGSSQTTIQVTRDKPGVLLKIMEVYNHEQTR